MPKLPPPDPYDPWPPGQRYRKGLPEPVEIIPVCSACGSRHRGATERCALTNEVEDNG